MVPGMKRLAVFVAVIFTAGLTQAQMQPAAKATDAKAATTNPADAKAAAKTGAKKDEKKKEEEPKIPGVTIPRPNGGYLGLEVAGGNFKLSFYDKKKKPAKVDVTRATARWPNPRAPGDNRTVLNVSGNALIGSKPVVPPFSFNVYLSLLDGEGDSARLVESYTVAFHN